MRGLLLASLIVLGGCVLGGCVPVGVELPPAPELNNETDVPLVLVCVNRQGRTIFADGEPIPVRYTEDGPNFSPPLTWTAGPAATRQWAILCEDVDAQPRPWVHWVIYNLPGEVRHLFEGVPSNVPDLWEPVGAFQGTNSWHEYNIGYYGPFPPVGGGVHRYRFTLYALDAPLDLPPGLSKSQLLDAMAGHVLTTAKLTGTFERPLDWRDPYNFSTPDSEADPDPAEDAQLGPGPPEPAGE